MKRKIIHVDMDAFYASVEIRERPELKDMPVIVGGSPNGRGVVSTCNYIARRYGIHSAMPSARAYQLCPQAVFVKSNFALYKATSKHIKDIFKRYTPVIEPLSMDEAYLDVTYNCDNQSATEVAEKIRQDIFDETSLTASAGVAPNKLLAKIASDINKPNGIMVVKPHQVPHFMKNLAVSKIPGVGKVTNKKLERMGIRTCGDVEPFRAELLAKGDRFGQWLLKRAKGLDNRPVVTSWTRKSLGHESTFFRDLSEVSEVEMEIQKIAKQVRERLLKSQVQGKTITLKVKYSDFQQITRSRSIDSYVDDAEVISFHCLDLLKKTEVGRRKVRLVGISLSNFNDGTQDKRTQYYQPTLKLV